jgi:hypothetical protein
VVDTISLRSTVVAGTGMLYTVAKAGEFVLKAPQTIVFSLLMWYGVWIAYNVAVDTLVSKYLRTE